MNPTSPPPPGVLFIVSAPSGAGKSSLLKALRQRHPELRLSVSFTTRPPRPGEEDGVHYHFLDEARFLALREAGAFLESATVFGNQYGTAEATLRAELEAGHSLLLEIDWQGARQVRARFPEAVSIFILPPSLEALEARLRDRGQDDETIIAGRMAAARDELSHYAEYDYVVINETFERALDDLACLQRAAHLRPPRRGRDLPKSLSALLSQVP